MKRVGCIGLGIMGSAMSANLVRAGFRVLGYDIAPARRRQLVRAGGFSLQSISEVAESASIVITSLPSAAALLQVSSEIQKAKGKTRIVIETSTMPIPVKEAARRTLARAGVVMLDCPLSGTGAQARAKDLVVYVSGARKASKAILPVLEGFSRAHYYLGAFGNGSKMKFAANLLVAIHNVSAAEAVILARKSGLSAALAVQVLGNGAGSSRMLQVRGPMMAKRRYRPATMSNALWQKDMKIIGEFVRRLRSPAPLFKATESIYRDTLSRGYGGDDTAAVCAVLERKPRGR